MDPISIMSAVIATISGVGAATALMGSIRQKRRAKRDKAEAESESAQQMWEFVDETHRTRYEERQRVRQEQGRGRESVARAVAATAEPAPFDPLDPNADKGWCQACPPDHPTGGLHPAASMKFPPSSTLWLCPECYNDYADPDSVLNSLQEPEQQAEDQPGEIEGQFNDFATEMETWGQQVVTAMQNPGIVSDHIRQFTQSRNFTCSLCKLEALSEQPVPVGPVLCKRCTAQLSKSSCHYCGDKLVSGYGLYKGKPACADCMVLDDPVPRSGTGPGSDELAERRMRKKRGA